MNVLTELVDFVKANLSIDIRNDLQGNQHICLLFGEEVISSVKFSEYDRV
jgi:hypothetical protein